MSDRLFLRSKSTRRFVTDLFSTFPSLSYIDVDQYSPNINVYPLSFLNIEGLKSFIQSEIERGSYYSDLQSYHMHSYNDLEIVRINADWNHAVNIQHIYGCVEYFNICEHIRKSFMYREMKQLCYVTDILNMYIGCTGFWSRDNCIFRNSYNNYDIFLSVSSNYLEIIRESGIRFWECNSYIWCNSNDLNHIKLITDLDIIPIYTAKMFEDIEMKYQQLKCY